MTPGERLLLKFCKPPQSGDSTQPEEGSVAAAKAELLTAFGEESLRTAVSGKQVLDFGCYAGYHMAALLELGAASVWGVDIQESGLEKARALLANEPRARVINGLDEPDWASEAQFDAIFSINSMEHVVEPEAWMRRWAGWLAPQGRLLIGFGPLWWSPYGAHMGFMTPLPWVHVLFPERTVLRVRERYRSDGAKRYEEVSGGLSRMSLRRFHNCIRTAGLQVADIRYTTIRSLPFVSRIPVARELLTMGLAATLRARPTVPGGAVQRRG